MVLIKQAALTPFSLQRRKSITQPLPYKRGKWVNFSQARDEIKGGFFKLGRESLRFKRKFNCMLTFKQAALTPFSLQRRKSIMQPLPYKRGKWVNFSHHSRITQAHLSLVLEKVLATPEAVCPRPKIPGPAPALGEKLLQAAALLAEQKVTASGCMS